MSVNLNINLPVNFWNYLANLILSPQYGFASTVGPSFPTPYTYIATATDLKDNISFTYSMITYPNYTSYKVISLSIQFSVDNSRNIQSDYLVSNYISMIITATIGTPSLPNPTSPNLNFTVFTNPTYSFPIINGDSTSIVTLEATDSGANVVNNENSVNPIFPECTYSINLEETYGILTEVYSNSSGNWYYPAFPLTFQITPYSGTSA